MSSLDESQIALFDAESDDALFLPVETMRKRYTSDQVKSIEAKKDLILLCVGAGIPTKNIAEAAKVNYRTVGAIAAKAAEEISRNKQDFAQFLHMAGAIEWVYNRR